jgi:RNA polymerase sigma factor (sigma-70 family)
VLAAAAATHSTTRRRGRAAGGAFLAASVALAVTVFEGIGGFAHGAGRPLGITLAVAGGWTAVSALLAWLVVGRGGSTLARRPLLVGAAAFATPFALFAWMHLFNGTYVEPYSAAGYRCLRYTLFVSALPLATFLALRRAVEPRYPAVLGAGAGAACAAWAYATGSDVLPWAFAIARNVLIDAKRRTRKEFLAIAPDDDDAEGVDRRVDRSSSPEGIAITRQMAEVMHQEMLQLPDGQRAAFDLVRGEGLSVAETAEILGTTRTAVKLRVHRVYEALRAVLR